MKIRNFIAIVLFLIVLVTGVAFSDVVNDLVVLRIADLEFLIDDNNKNIARLQALNTQHQTEIDALNALEIIVNPI